MYRDPSSGARELLTCPGDDRTLRIGGPTTVPALRGVSLHLGGVNTLIAEGTCPYVTRGLIRHRCPYEQVAHTGQLAGKGNYGQDRSMMALAVNDHAVLAAGMARRAELLGPDFDISPVQSGGSGLLCCVLGRRIRIFSTPTTQCRWWRA